MITKNLSRMLIVCLLLSGAAVVLAENAQPPGGRSGSAGIGRRAGGRGNQPPAVPDSTRIVQMVEEMAGSLSLTDDQKDEVLELHFAHFAEVEARMAGANDDREEHREEMEALRAEFQNDVKALLDDEQKAKYEELMKERGRRGGRAGDGPGRRGR